MKKEIKQTGAFGRRIFLVSAIAAVGMSVNGATFVNADERQKSENREVVGLDKDTDMSLESNLPEEVENHSMGSSLVQTRLRGASWVDTIKIGDPTRPRFDMVDLASYQSWMTQTHFDELYKSGVRAAIIKTTESTNYVNLAAAGQIQRAKAAGLNVAIYHYARFNSINSAKAEASFALKTVKQMGLPKSTPIVADVEENGSVTGDVKTNLNSFWQVFSNAGYNVHRVYTGGGYTKAAQAISTVGNKQTWWAQYPYTPSRDSLWNTQYGAWQFSSTAQLPSQYGKAGANNIDVSIDYAGLFTNKNTPEGPEIQDDRYITVTVPKNQLYADFRFISMHTTDEMMNKTFHSVGKYHHQNGATYLKLVDAQGNYMGLMNEKAGVIASGAQGIGFSMQDEGVITLANNAIYSDFNWHATNNTTKIIGKHVKVAAKYLHLNGMAYYSLRDQDGKWLGYANSGVVALKSQHQGTAKDYYRYVTIPNANINIWTDFNWALGSAKTLEKKTLLAKQQYVHQNGRVYLSLYDINSKHIGYVDSSEVIISNGPQGTGFSLNQYVTLNKKNKPIFGNFNENKISDSSSHFRKTYLASGEYYLFNGKRFLTLYNSQKKWIGYVNSSDVDFAPGNQGTGVSEKGTATVNKKDGRIWKSFAFTQNVSTNNYLGQKLKYTAKYNAFNGYTYYSVYSDNGTWIGYANQLDLSLNEPEDITISESRYVSLVSKKPVIFSDLNGHEKKPNKAAVNGTYISKVKYKRSTGKVYLSIYNSNGEWVGYVDEKETATAQGVQGIGFSLGKYVTITKRDKPIYENFSEKQIGTTSHLFRQTFLAIGQYFLFNSKRWLTLYDNNNKWLGYIDADSATVADGIQGSGQTEKGKLTVSKPNGRIWKGFNFVQNVSTNDYLGQTLDYRAKYTAFNGYSYYSVYTKTGTWVGYANALDVTLAKVQPDSVAENRYVSIVANNATLYSNLQLSVKSSDSSLYRKTLLSKVKYSMRNGQTILSLYDNKNQWLGYIDARETKSAEGIQGIGFKLNRQVRLTKNAKPIFGNVQESVIGNSGKYLNKTFKASGEYFLFNGKHLLSLYDGRGWIGYMEANDVSFID